jgi:hypothetical protein
MIREPRVSEDAPNSRQREQSRDRSLPAIEMSHLHKAYGQTVGVDGREAVRMPMTRHRDDWRNDCAQS